MAEFQGTVRIKVEERGRGPAPVEEKRTRSKSKAPEAFSMEGKLGQIITNMDNQVESLEHSSEASEGHAIEK